MTVWPIKKKQAPYNPVAFNTSFTMVCKCGSFIDIDLKNFIVVDHTNTCKSRIEIKEISCSECNKKYTYNSMIMMPIGVGPINIIFTEKL